MNKLLVTFCARKAPIWSRTGIIGIYDGKWDFVKIKKRGFQGVCFKDKKVWLAGYKKIHCFEDIRKPPVKTVKDKRFSGLHSLQADKDGILIVSAGNNCIYKYNGIVTKIYSCANHPNTINDHYVTCLNKGGHSGVYNIWKGTYQTNSSWYMSHNYTRFDDNRQYIILNGDGTVINNGGMIALYPDRFLRGLLVKDDNTYIGLNWFMEYSTRDYQPPQIAVLNTRNGKTERFIEISQMKCPWVIYDIVECPEWVT